MQKAFVKAIISLLIFHSFSPLFVSSYDHTLKQGEKLNSSSYLVSAKGIFTLGFYTPENSYHSYLGIWYTNITWYPVWLANRNTPVYKDSAIFTVTTTGEAIITHDGADPIELYAAKSRTNIAATLLDSGNLVLKEIETNGLSEGKILWQSFDYPTDVLLPGMKLGISHRTGRNWTLTSWFSPNNPASGAFTLEWDSIRQRLVIRRRVMVYWTSGDLRLYYEGNNLKLHAFDYMHAKPDAGKWNYNLMNVSNQDEEYFTYSLFHVRYLTDEAQRDISGWRLDYQGNVKDYDMPYNDWNYIAKADKCYGYSNKGYYLGCALWEIPECRKTYQEFGLRPGDFEFKTAVYLYDNGSSLSHSDCRDTCWNDCNCVGFMAEEIGCSYWRGKNARFVYDSGSRSRYVLVSHPSKKRAIWKWIIISVAIVVVLLSITGAASFVLIRKYKQGRKKKIEELQELEELMKLEGYTEESEFENDGGNGPHLRSFTYASILASTNCFSLNNKLGEGGFGPVYKGKTTEGREIAIKLLSRRSEQGLLEFKTELILISKLQHRNLVKLVGFCIHKNEKMIIYDYMPNRSLDFYLFDPAKSEQLNWERRFNIIEGIAQGLLYLHKFSRVMIVHRDLKASNILLDENMNPKISDFGMARIFKRDVEEANTYNRAGTYGYMAPEYAMQGVFSVKSDIYSFGVLILEIVSGRRNNSFRHLDGPLSLIEFAWELYKESAELELMDPTINNSSDVKDQVRRCIIVGLLCVENSAVDRPFIEDVIPMLKNETISLPMPKKPAFILRDDVVQKLRQARSQKFSRNEFSVSVVDGR